MIAPIDMRQLPISFKHSEILLSVIGSHKALVILYITAIIIIFIKGTNMSNSKIIIPKIPTTLFMDDIHLKNKSTVSDVKPPTIGIKALKEYFAVFIKSPSDVSVKRP